MSTAFTPPPVSSWEGPSGDGFKPPPPSAWEGPAQPAPTEDRPSALSRGWSGFASAINPFPAIKHYLYDQPQQDAAEMQQHLQKGEYGSAIGTALRQAIPGSHLVPDALSAQGEQFQKAGAAMQDKELTPEGRLSSAAGHALAGVVPLVGPAAANAGERIGSGDVAGGIGEGAGVIANVIGPKILGKAGEAIGAKLPEKLRSASEENYAKAINPTTRANKALVENKIAPGLRERKVTAMSREGLINKAQSNMGDFGQQIDDFMQNNGQIPLNGKDVIDALDNLKFGKMRGMNIPSVNQPYVNAIGEVQNDLDAMMRANSGKLTLDDMRWLRQQYDTTAAAKNAFALPPAEQSKIAAITDATNAIRGHIANQFPELDALNKQYSFWNNTRDVTQASKTRAQGQKQPLTEMMAKPIGAAVGMHGGIGGAYATAEIAGKLARFRNSMAWRSLKAATQQRIAEAMDSGNMQQAAQLASQATGGAALAGNPEDKPQQRVVPGTIIRNKADPTHRLQWDGQQWQPVQ